MSEENKNKNVISGILDGFIHKPGVHCITSALRDVFEFHGFNLSEEMFFGLGSGLSLGYINMRGTPDPILGGRSRNPEDIACKLLGVGVSKFTTNNSEKGWIRLKERLDKGIPSMILIDMAYLPYHNLPEDYHFGQHGIAVCGYNAEKDVVLVSDTAFEEIQEVSTKNLMKGRSSTVSKWMDPRNMIYEFSFPSKLTDVNQIIPAALQQAGKNILKPSRFMSLIGITNGLKAIDKFCNDLLKWVNMPKKELYNRCFLLAGYISEFGTGGGSFRYLYSRFLNECSDVLDDSSLIDLSLAYSQLGDKWENVAGLFREVQETKMEPDEVKTYFKSIANHLYDIKELESQNALLLVNYT